MNEEVQDEQVPGVTAPYRWGPTPLFTAGALALSAAELIAIFTRKPLDPYKDELLIGCTVFTSLFFWLSAVWAVSFLLRAVQRISARPARFITFAGLALVCTVLFCLYLACWAGFLYSGVFPDQEMLGFLSSGSRSELNFMLSVIQQTLPNAPLQGAVLVGAVAVLLPVGLRKAQQIPWRPRRLPWQHGSALLVWAFSGLLALYLAGMISTVDDLQKRETALLRLKTQLNPVLSLASALFQGIAPEEIPKEMDLSLLSPIEPNPPPDPTDVQRLANGPNILYLAVESLRADMIGQKFQGQLVMPNLTALAEKSLVFTRAHSQATHTDYSITSYLSSLYPMRSLKHYHPRLDAGFPRCMVYDWLKLYGYNTGIITSDNTDWCNMYGLMWSRSLDTFFDSRNMPTTYSARLKGFAAREKEPSSSRGAPLDDAFTVDYALPWLADHIGKKQPYFLHMMFQQTHFAYSLPENVTPQFAQDPLNFTMTFDGYDQNKVETVRAAYYNACYYVDVQLGRIIEFLQQHDQLDNTIIALVGDHGEGFLEHNLVTHSRLPYEEFCHVPMIIYLPPGLAQKAGAPRKEDYPVQQIDMAPTLCGLLGLPVPREFQGIDALSLERPSLDERYTFTHVEAPGQASGEAVLYAGRWKLISDRLSNLDYLYDLQNDPAEKHDVKAANPQITARLRRKLQVWRSSHLTYHAYNMYYEHYFQPRMRAED